MAQNNVDFWLDEVLPRHERLTESVVNIFENLLNNSGAEYLAVSGRTKDKNAALEKIKRKGYRDPSDQLTDLSGIRVIVYFESDVQVVSEIIEKSFSVDTEKSLNKDDVLSTDQIGYRSVHYVCDLGDGRGGLPEFNGLSGLKFEFQVRTVLQHAWAELAHDRGYKFSAKLPKDIERKLYLYAGMLEIADKGFDEIASEIDDYVSRLQVNARDGDLSEEINSLSLRQFVAQWCEDHGIPFAYLPDYARIDDLVSELHDFGVDDLRGLRDIIPKGYAEAGRRLGREENVLGLVRNWMLLSDWRSFVKNVKFNWVIDPEEVDEVLRSLMGAEEYGELLEAFDAQGWLIRM